MKISRVDKLSRVDKFWILIMAAAALGGIAVLFDWAAVVVIVIITVICVWVKR